MTEDLNALIVGCGRMGTRLNQAPFGPNYPESVKPISHAESIEQLSGIELTGLVDTNEELLRRCCTKYGVPGYKSLEVALRESYFDIVTVATRTPPRFDIINLCVEAGIKLMHVEKPLCNSVIQLLKLEELASTRDFGLTLGTFRRYCDLFVETREEAYSGKYGKPLRAYIEYGVGPLMWSHPHSFDMANFVANDREALRVRSMMCNLKAERGLGSGMIEIESDPEHVYSHIVYDDFEVFVTPKNGYTFCIECEAGRVGLAGDGLSDLVTKRLDQSPYYMVATGKGEEDIRQRRSRSMVDGEKTGSKAPLSLLLESADNSELRNIVTSLSLSAQRLLFASAQSALENRWIEPRHLDDR